MQNLDEYLYEQTNAGQEELAEWRDEKRKEREREMDDADNAIHQFQIVRKLLHEQPPETGEKIANLI